MTNLTVAFADTAVARLIPNTTNKKLYSSSSTNKFLITMGFMDMAYSKDFEAFKSLFQSAVDQWRDKRYYSQIEVSFCKNTTSLEAVVECADILEAKRVAQCFDTIKTLFNTFGINKLSEQGVFGLVRTFRTSNYEILLSRDLCGSGAIEYSCSVFKHPQTAKSVTELSHVKRMYFQTKSSHYGSSNPLEALKNAHKRMKQINQI